MVLASPIAPVGGHQLMLFLLQVGLLLGLAVLLGRLAMRLGLPGIVGELCAGVLLGPSVLAKLWPGLSSALFPPDPGQVHLLDGVGQLGVLLLVGITGAYMDLDLVRRTGSTAARVSAGGMLVPLGLGIGLGFILPSALLAGRADRTVFALFLGVAMCVSAIPVISKILLEMRYLHRDVAQLTLSAAVVDDVAGWLMLSVVSAMAIGGLGPGQIAYSVGALVGVVLVAVGIARPLVGWLLRRCAPGDRTGVTTLIVLLVLLSAAGTQALGLEAVLGAFLCGMVIRSSRAIDVAEVAPLRTLVMGTLAPLFFATAGLRIDLTGLQRPAVLLAAAAVLCVAIAGKFIGAYIGARSSRLSNWEALALGAGLNARGVIEVIVAMTGLRLGVLGTDAYSIIVLVAIVTSLMAPPVLRVALRRIGTTPAERERERALVGSTSD